MGFSLTCAALCCLSMSTYTPYLSNYAGQNMKMFHFGGYAEDKIVLKDYAIDLDPRDKEDHALVGSIFGFIVLELLLSLWSVAACLTRDQSQLPACETVCYEFQTITGSLDLLKPFFSWVVLTTVNQSSNLRLGLILQT